MTVALIIIQNHKYLNNLEILDSLYSDRFPQILHLVPFYEGERNDVIGVYENSYYFQGYVSQAARRLANIDCSHFLFIADDLLLNPAVSERTFCSEFNIRDELTGFISGFIDFSKITHGWKRAREALNWRLDVSGIEAQNELLAVDSARERFNALELDGHTVQIRSLKVRRLNRISGHLKRGEFSSIVRLLGADIVSWLELLAYLPKSRRRLSYPLVGGYSDVFAIPKSSLARFAHLCGVFAATGLFAEIAIPTAMALSVDRVSTMAKCRRQGRALWGDDINFLDQFDLNLPLLLREFPKEYLYLHPIKLSQWSRTTR